MAHEVVHCELGIGGIVLGAAGHKGFAVLGQALWIDGKEDQEVVFLQCGDDRSFTEFECHGDGPTEALIQRLRPYLDGFGCVLDTLEYPLLAASELQADVVLCAGPVDTDVGRVRFSRKLIHDSSPPGTISHRGMHA